ncbi:MAG: hypothetical protein EOO47_23740 [Flavobacterium sp.]|nr:MAG: hypothetical protein EOO47_23740 [Flavobacterium sp.]
MRILLSLAVLCSLSAQTMARNDVTTYPGTIIASGAQEIDQKEAALDKMVQQIDADCAAINEKKLNIRIAKIEEGAFAEGCPVTANVTYSNAAGEPVEKIERWLAGDSTEEMIEFYYKAGKLFFVMRKQVYYPPNTADDPVQSELKIYFDKGKAIKYSSNQGDTYQTMDFSAEVNEGTALYKAATKEQVRDAICPAK